MHSCKYRVASFLLAFVTCISLLGLPNSAQLHVHGEEPGTAAAEAVESASTQEKTKPALSTDRYEQLYGAPVEILSASTYDLLNYFLQSVFMKEMIHSELALFCVSEEPPYRADLYYHNEAFVELISRPDLALALELTGRQISMLSFDPLSTYENSDWVKSEAIRELLKHPEVASVVEAAVTKNSVVFPYLTQNQTTDQNQHDYLYENTYEIGDFIGYFLEIPFYYGGLMPTASYDYDDLTSVLGVELITAGEEFNDSQIEQYRSQYAHMEGIVLVHDPSIFYNCHSYAWYLTSSDNRYVINEIDAFLNDPLCTPIDRSQVQKNDIVVYYQNYGEDDEYAVHSGVVHSIENAETNNPIIMIESKWGVAGVYIHTESAVPTNYYDSDGEPDCHYYRYHDYSYVYLSSNYHKGRIHTYVYTHQCSICNDIFYTTESLPCNGPPCIIPVITSLDDEDDVVN